MNGPRLLPENFAGRGSPEQFERAFDESGIGTAVIVALVSRQLDLEVPNRFVAEQVAKDPKRRIGVASVDPNDPDALDELSRAADLGLRGVKLSPPYQGFHPHAPQAWAVYEAAARLGMFLLFHSRVGVRSSAVPSRRQTRFCSIELPALCQRPK